MISLDRMGLTLGNFSLADLSFSVEDGEYFVLLGPSGVGKTTILEAVAGLTPVKTGRILLDHVDVTRLPPEERRVAYVPQDASLFPHLNVKENILFGVRARRTPGSEWNPRFDDLVESLQIGKLLDRSTANLSGGERRRAALARALITAPRIVLLDEPFNGLDPPIRHELQILVKRLQRHLKGTFLHVTHDREEAFILADVIAVLIDGKIEQIAKRNRVYFRPRNLKVARFTGMENVIEGEVVTVDGDAASFTVKWSDNRLVVTSDQSSPRVGEHVLLGFRAEEVMFVKPDKPIREGRDFNIVSGVLSEVLEKGAMHTIVISEQSSGQSINMEIPNFLYRRYTFQQGQRIEVRVGPDKFCVMQQ